MKNDKWNIEALRPDERKVVIAHHNSIVDSMMQRKKAPKCTKEEMQQVAVGYKKRDDLEFPNTHAGFKARMQQQFSAGVIANASQEVLDKEI